MKAKTANLIICRKFDLWVASIEDEALRERVKGNTILTGGAIVTLLTENKVNDFDFYFRDLETTERVAKYYVEKFKVNPPARFKGGEAVKIWVETNEGRVKIVVKSAGVAGEPKEGKPYEYFEQSTDTSAQAQFLDDIDPANSAAMLDAAETVAEMEKPEVGDEKPKPKYRPIYLTSNAISLSDKVQIIIRFYGEPSEIHENYDFVHCTNYWTSWERRVTTNKEALECILAKELRYIGSKYPVASLFRVRKFIQRGWTITAGQLLKPILQCAKLNFEDFEVLEEQLTGVDVAYFHQLIDAMRERDPNKVDSTYIVELIDRLS